VLVSGGLQLDPPEEVDTWNFAPRVQVPVLMLNGRSDFMAPFEPNQRLLFENLIRQNLAFLSERHSAEFMARLNVGQGQLCYTLTSAKVGTLTMAHIHAGKAGVAGPPVVTLKASAPSETCMALDKATAQKIVAAPGDYYVNVHTADFPSGAIRGQLAKH